MVERREPDHPPGNGQGGGQRQQERPPGVHEHRPVGRPVLAREPLAERIAEARDLGLEARDLGLDGTHGPAHREHLFAPAPLLAQKPVELAERVAVLVDARREVADVDRPHPHGVHERRDREDGRDEVRDERPVHPRGALDGRTSRDVAHVPGEVPGHDEEGRRDDERAQVRPPHRRENIVSPQGGGDLHRLAARGPNRRPEDSELSLQRRARDEREQRHHHV